MIKTSIKVAVLPSIVSIFLYDLEPSNTTFTTLLMTLSILTSLVLVYIGISLRSTVEPVDSTNQDNSEALNDSLRLIESLESHIEHMERKHALMLKYKSTPLYSIIKRHKDDNIR